MSTRLVRQQALPLDELEAFYSGQETTTHRLRDLFGLPINAFGASLWPGVEGTIFASTLKAFVFVGPVRLRALHVRGLFDRHHRAELAGTRGEDLGGYLWHALILLVWGVPFGRVGDRVKILKDPPTQPGQQTRPSGTFTLMRRGRGR